ncbi:hypothetical protein FBULB1_327 [Fusarium bulbicola]|nr:hypothetical protein FBULB1_327 [Fusarium bulbicola]
MIIFLPVDSSFWQQEARLAAVLDLLDEACPFHGGSCEVYPSRHEATSAVTKMPDIRALDRIAKDAPFNYAYRPKTCFGHGKCQLADQETTIVKGTFSCAALHVQTRGDDELPLPLLRRDWFHQEKVFTLQS